MKKMNKRILCSALVLCGAFSMSTISVSAEEAEKLPETTTVVTSEVLDTSEIPLVTTIPNEDEPPEATTNEFGIDDIPDIDGLDKDDIISVETLPAGNGTLLEDVSDEVVDRQFITIQSKNGNTFYIVIDKDSKGNENVYFMNLVDEYDLLAFSEDFPEEVQAELGVGEEAETTAVTDEDGNPVETTSDEEGTEETPTETQESGGNSLFIPILLLLAGGGGAFYYFKVYKPKQNSKPKKSQSYDEDEYDDEPDEVVVNEDNAEDNEDE